MILVTGANGITGRAIIQTLLSKGEQVRGLVHRVEQIDELKSLGTTEVVVGDIIIGAAMTAKVKHFVYHSVLHSVIQEMPHHQKKLMVEEKLVNSGVPYTIIQPAVYMQVLNDPIKVAAKDGIFHQNFFTTKETRICMVDLKDVAEAACIILTKPGYKWATYQICGPENLSLDDMSAPLKKYFGNELKVEISSDEQKTTQFKKYKLGEYKTDTLLRMFKHYNEFGFNGNSNVLEWILGRKPNNFSSFILQSIQNN